MPDFKLIPSIFEAAVDAASKQVGYMSSIRSYVDAHTNLGDMSGLVMLCLGPMYESARSNAVTGLSEGETIATAVETKTTETLEAYKEVDSGLGEGFNSIGSAMADDYETVSFSYGPGATADERPGDVAPGVATYGDTTTPLDKWNTGAQRWASRDLKGTQWEDTYDTSQGLGAYADELKQHPFRDAYEEALFGEDGVDGVRDMYGTSTDYRYAQGQRAAYGYAGLEAPPPTSDWVDNQMTARTTRAAGQVYKFYNEATGAYSAVQDAAAASDRADRMGDMAQRRPRNHDNTDWAN